VVEKVPFEKTIQHVVLSGTPKEAARALADYERKCAATALMKKYGMMQRATVFNFHATPANEKARSHNNPPHKFSIGSEPFADALSSEILFLPKGRNYYVDVPATYHPVAPDLLEGRKKRLEQVQGEFTSFGRATRNLHPKYFLEVNKLGAPEQEKYMDPAITMKIANEIHQILEKGKRTNKRKP